MIRSEPLSVRRALIFVGCVPVGVCLQPVDEYHLMLASSVGTLCACRICKNFKEVQLILQISKVYPRADLEQCRRALQAAVPFPMLCPAAYSANL